ncbi:MAG TPA: S41 family peptidase, partial [Roseiflexaceae bacterium]|nr:S41 family peptidase [Roseiflexaceae bacterium]
TPAPASPTAQPPAPTPPPTRAPTATAAPTPPPPTPTLDVLPLEERRQIFEEVWRTVKEEYLYADFRGVDWDGLRAVYAERIEAEQSREEFYATMVELVSQLDDNHSRFVPPAAAQAEDIITSGRETRVGIGVVVRPKVDGAFIQLVFPDGPADRAGLRPRDRIVAVDGRPYTLADGDLRGEAGSEVRLSVVRPGAKLRDVVVVRQEVRAHILPYYRRFPGDVGYVAIPTFWANDMGEQVSGALTDLVASGALRGVILDVRSNRGGWGEVLNEVLSHFVRGQVGVFFGRDYVRPLVVAPPAGPDLRGVPLVVLVDGETASYAEVLAAVLQREAGAMVVGTPSAGNTETIYAHTLSDGSRLWLAQESFRLQDGANLEGVGVMPSVLLESDWTRYSEEDDPQLLEALRLLGAGPK